jgi:hypothetical protein
MKPLILGTVGTLAQVKVEVVDIKRTHSAGFIYKSSTLRCSKKVVRPTRL